MVAEGAGGGSEGGRGVRGQRKENRPVASAGLVGAMWIPQICALSLASSLASVFWGGAALYETRCQVGLPQGRAADNVSREQDASLACLYIDVNVDAASRRVCQADQGATRSHKEQQAETWPRRPALWIMYMDDLCVSPAPTSSKCPAPNSRPMTATETASRRPTLVRLPRSAGANPRPPCGQPSTLISSTPCQTNWAAATVVEDEFGPVCFVGEKARVGAARFTPSPGYIASAQPRDWRL